MIVQEILWQGTVKTYSNEGKYIIQIGTEEKYPEAIDPVSAHREYYESDEYIEKDEPGEDGEDTPNI